ncbi:MAG: NrtA/SsuA/CpmA family ABC transporter substrate-binding protein [Alphaproteobacteria bacterium]|uniref:NrtA/SsuA/CpmA family ABC transporter substrate-binding protein n=1 Tax=Candidatus Nitrobium versatile TaxID=2884831 RepID=A0A953JD47_9BACT|nr:NrtA/SsuA/CpmA family ABC transporter substrate-binding protein [Candidatus Nitrobium versatile]
MKVLFRAKKTVLPAMSLLFLITGIVLALLYSRRTPRPAEEVTIAVSAVPLSAPVYVAYAKGFFEREGLQVTLQKHEVGKDALDAVIAGKAHFCTVAETPLVFAGLNGEKIYIIATLADSNRYIKIAARKDRGIAGPKDLEGKTIGVRKGTTSEYFLHAYLTFYRIAKDRIHVVDMRFNEMTGALLQGIIDAAVSWPPYLTEQQKRLGANGMTLSNEHIYKIYGNVAARQEFVAVHPEAVKKLLRALIQAQQYIEENPKDAQRIVDGCVGKGAAALDDFNFDVRLSQSLIFALEEQARWAISNRRTDRKEVPNFLRLLYTKGMEEVAPDSVMVIHN